MGIDLTGTGNTISNDQLATLAADSGLAVSRLHAIRKVEAPRGPFDRHNRLTALHEFHIFWRKLPQSQRAEARRRGLAHPSWGGFKYGSYNDQYERIIRASALDEPAEYLSFSSGSFQMMGFNFKVCGFSSAKEMVEAYKKGEFEQTQGALNFIKSSQKMYSALKYGKWKEFARAYNGPGYAKNRYDVKLAAADRMARQLNSTDAVEATLEPASSPNPIVKEAQGHLITLGYDVGREGADGWMGQDTKKAVLKFQGTHPDLANDGLIGTHTLAALEAAIKLTAGQEKEAVKGAGGVVAGGVVAGGTALAGAPMWVWIAIALVGVAVAGFIYWRYTKNFNWEREQIANIRDGKVVEVDPVAERFMSMSPEAA